MKRLIAAVAAALMIAVGVPGVAKASLGGVFDALGNSELNNVFHCTASLDSSGIGYSNLLFFSSPLPLKSLTLTFRDQGSFTGAVIEFFAMEGEGDVGEKVGELNYAASQVTSLSDGGAIFVYFKGDIAIEGESYYWMRPTAPNFPNAQVCENNQNPLTSLEIDLVGEPGNWFYLYPPGNGGNSEFFTWVRHMSFSLNGTLPPTTDPLTTSTPTLKRNGISFTPDNFDPSCAYEISTTAGTVKQNPVTGEVNVYGVGSGTSVTVTITDCTGATATVSGTATAATAPVQTLTKPTVATAADAITCTAGTSSVNPTSIAYTLLVDGVAVSTRFSDGAIAPSLVATTSAQNLYTGATLSKATWTVDPAWAGKSYSCTTTSYAAGAVGIANS
jgi:hypothetical protein